jgi:zinc dependent phospholipase C
MRLAIATAFVVTLTLLPSRPAHAFSVLAHQAVVDRSWDATLAPEIRRRFPGADLSHARAFAYGGSHLADLGYFPLGSKLFTNLLHYVRTGDFVTSLAAEAHDANEYAFALGALAHYVADTIGHPEATNRVVPEIYPKLREKFGDQVTYADDASAHLQTEFRFDVFQMARTHGGSDLLHHALQFAVAKRCLDAAMHDTYGLGLDDLFANTDVAILTYRWAFRGLLHEATGVAWELYRADIQGLDPDATPAGFVYDLSRADFEREFGKAFLEPGYFAKTFAFLTKLVPNVGPLKRSIFKPLPPEARTQFAAALDHAVANYHARVGALAQRRAGLPSRNLDTAKAVRFGEYPPADDAYAALVQKLTERNAAISDPLRADLRRFYADRPTEIGTRDGHALDDALAQLAIAAPPRRSQ